MCCEADALVLQSTLVKTRRGEAHLFRTRPGGVLLKKDSGARTTALQERRVHLLRCDQASLGEGEGPQLQHTVRLRISLTLLTDAHYTGVMAWTGMTTLA